MFDSSMVNEPSGLEPLEVLLYIGHIIHYPFHPRVSDMDSSISEFEHIRYRKLGFQSKIKNKKERSVDPDETVRDEPSHLDLHCLQMYLY